MSRRRFVVWLVMAAALIILPIYATTLAFEQMIVWAERLGMNAAVLQNIIILALGWLGVLLLVLAGSVRLRDAGEPPALVVIGLVPLATAATLNGPLVIRPYLDLGPAANGVFLTVFAGVAAYAIIICLFYPSGTSKSH